MFVSYMVTAAGSLNPTLTKEANLGDPNAYKCSITHPLITNCGETFVAKSKIGSIVNIPYVSDYTDANVG